jgi:hypothetical protein
MRALFATKHVNVHKDKIAYCARNRPQTWGLTTTIGKLQPIDLPIWEFWKLPHYEDLFNSSKKRGLSSAILFQQVIDTVIGKG